MFRFKFNELTEKQKYCYNVSAFGRSCALQLKIALNSNMSVLEIVSDNFLIDCANGRISEYVSEYPNCKKYFERLHDILYTTFCMSEPPSYMIANSKEKYDDYAIFGFTSEFKPANLREAMFYNACISGMITPHVETICKKADISPNKLQSSVKAVCDGEMKITDLIRLAPRYKYNLNRLVQLYGMMNFWYGNEDVLSKSEKDKATLLGRFYE